MTACGRRGGSDYLVGLGGDDVLSSQVDTVGFTSASLEGDLGNDTLISGGGNDLLSGGAGDDVLYGGGGDENDMGADELRGGDGNDTLFGGFDYGTAANSDGMAGGAGADTFYIDAAGRTVLIDDFALGTDVIRIVDPNGAPFEALSVQTAGDGWLDLRYGSTVVATLQNIDDSDLDLTRDVIVQQFAR